VILEGDALEITTALGRTKVEAGKYGNLILNAKSLLRGFWSCDVTCVRREGNMVAHTFEKFAIFFEQTKV
jgi:hypothetical protein